VPPPKESPRPKTSLMREVRAHEFSTSQFIFSSSRQKTGAANAHYQPGAAANAHHEPGAAANAHHEPGAAVSAHHEWSAAVNAHDERGAAANAHQRLLSSGWEAACTS
jgi:hypothetical protein